MRVERSGFEVSYKCPCGSYTWYQTRCCSKCGRWGQSQVQVTARQVDEYDTWFHWITDRPSRTYFEEPTFIKETNG